MLCSLCSCRTLDKEIINQREYLQCLNCKAIFLSPAHYLDRKLEKERYEEHNNDVTDPRYQEFVRPVVDKILEENSPASTGLDYGCGTGPVISSELKKKGFSTTLYDIYFQPDTSAFNRQYDYIICCEVMEHFHDPVEEFGRLRSLLKEGGSLYCKTSLYEEKIEFRTWYYKDDPTHVCFYTRDGLKYLRKSLGFSKLEILEKLIVFRK